MAKSRRDARKVPFMRPVAFAALLPCFPRHGPEDKYECARVHRYCINCLATSHATGECDSRSSCHRCTLGHHTLLRRAKLRRVSGAANAANPTQALSSRFTQQRKKLQQLVKDVRSLIGKLEREIQAPTLGGRHVEDMDLLSFSK